MSRPTRRSGWWFVASGVSAVLLILLTGCGATSTPGDRATSTTTVDAPRARVTTLDVPAATACNGATSVLIPVRYSVEDAVRQELFVDGRPEPLASDTGTVSVAVRCDPLPHSIVVIAYDAQDRRSPRAVKVSTTP